MRVTIKDIAIKANTSRGTVDRVINERGKVDPAVKQRVLAAINSLGYESNEFARALVKTKQKYKIGVVLNALNHQFYQRIKDGILLQQKSDSRFDFIILENELYDSNTQINHINLLLDQAIDGLIITPALDNLVSSKLSELSIPVVVIAHDTNFNAKIAFVGCDYYSNGVIGSDLVNALNTNNKILIMIGDQSILSYKLRIEGFLMNLDKNIKFDIITIDNTSEDAKNKSRKYFASNHASTIYFAGFGISGLLATITAEKLNVKVVAVDETDDVISGLKNSLVAITVTQQPEKQGYRAAQIICDYLFLNKKPQLINYIGNKIKVKNSNFNEKITRRK